MVISYPLKITSSHCHFTCLSTYFLDKHQTVLFLYAFFTFYWVLSEHFLSWFQLFEAGFFFKAEGKYMLCDEFLKS